MRSEGEMLTLPLALTIELATAAPLRLASRPLAFSDCD